MSKKMKKSILSTTILLVLLALMACNDHDGDDNSNGKAVTRTLNVDVVLPAAIQAEWQNTFDWAQANIAKAQLMENRKVQFNLRFHDEDTEDLQALARRLANPEAGDDTCHAIIGPYHSDNAPIFLKQAGGTRLPVMMPTCTSAELQRTNDRNTYAWFLTESDVTQCNIMLSAARIMRASDVALLYTNDIYGSSFYDWFGYMATEQSLTIIPDGLQAYNHGDQLEEFFSHVDEQKDSMAFICLALSDPKEYTAVNQQLLDYKQKKKMESPNYDTNALMLIFADVALTETTRKEEEPLHGIGICPVGNMYFGFPQSYKERFGRTPYNGEAQLYDALTIIALGEAARLASPDKCIVANKEVHYDKAPYDPGLTDWMRSNLSRTDGIITSWTDDGLATAFHEVGLGHAPDITGATGFLYFAPPTYTKVLQTLYMAWTMTADEDKDGLHDICPVIYLSTSGTYSSASTQTIWDWDKQFTQILDEVTEEHSLPDVTDHWAVVVSPSTTWSNYRHQADAFAMYQLLKLHGYDDDHIVLIVEDNLANMSENLFPGKIFALRGNDNNSSYLYLYNRDVREGAKVDYHFTDLKPEDMEDIMMGNSSERLAQVIHPTATSNVFFFWSGHGGAIDGPLWGNENARYGFGKFRIKQLVERMHHEEKFRRMMLTLETCFSGKWGEMLEGIPNVIALTAANAYEPSHADGLDPDLNVYLSNAFSRTFFNDISIYNKVSLNNLFLDLAKSTVGSHVTLYNYKNYGDVKKNTMEDFFPK